MNHSSFTSTFHSHFQVLKWILISIASTDMHLHPFTPPLLHTLIPIS